MRKISGLFLLVLLFTWTASGQQARVTAARANLRQAPSTTSRVVSRVIRGTSVTILKDQAPWYQVRTASKSVGWLHVSTIDLKDAIVKSPRDPNKYTVVGGDYEASNEPPPPPLKGRRSISGGVLNGRATSLPKPVYPSAARVVRASGAVNVQVLIDEEGNVVSATAISGHPLLRASAVQAAREAHFSPTRLGGQPVKVSGVITYNFVP